LEQLASTFLAGTNLRERTVLYFVEIRRKGFTIMDYGLIKGATRSMP
jgi:hypothetical protein